MSYSWTGPIIIKRVRDAVILNFRRAFSYDPKYPYVQTANLTALTGTVTVSTGSNIVVGTGTNFLTAVSVGNAMQFASQVGATYFVQSITSDTSLTLTTSYTGTVAGVTSSSAGSNLSIDFDCSKIAINDATPNDYYMLPSINIMTASGEEHRFIQEDFFEPFIDNNGELSERRGAPLDIVVTVEATALDVITRDELVDRMYEKFKLITDDLANNGIGILKTSIRPDRRDFRGDRWFYTSGVNLYLYAEWLDENLTNPNSTVTGIGGHIYTDQGIDQPFQL